MNESKKSFLMNPAFSFISQESIDAVENRAKQSTDSPAEKKPEKKPATIRERAVPEPVTTAEPSRRKKGGDTGEFKSRRVQILVQPSVYEEISAKAKMLGISVNEAINNAMKEYVR